MIIAHFNDVYNVEEAAREPVAGAARFVGALNSMQAQTKALLGTSSDDPVLVLFSGDAYNPSLMSQVTKGKQMPPVLNACGVSASCVGNHDFDFGVDNLMALNSECNFPWLMANVIDKSTSEPLGMAKRTCIIHHLGVKIGVVGLVEREWLATLATVDESAVDYLDFVEEGRRLATQLREEEGCAMVIALTHMRQPNDELLAASAPEFDLVLGGHDHHYHCAAVEPHGTLLSKSGTDFRDITRIEMKVPPGGARPSVAKHERVVIDSTQPVDEAVAEIVAAYSGVVGAKMDQIIGELATELDGRFTSIRTSETALGNFVCDLFRESSGADMALLNSGTLRSDVVHTPGPFLMRDLISILPMLDETVTIEITGTQLIEALENGVSQYPKLEGRFPQVSGMKFKFHADREPGSRVERESVVVGDEAVQDDRVYTMCTKAYLAQGKDGYDVFGNCKVIRDTEVSPFLPTIIRNHFQTLSVVNGFSQVFSPVAKAASKFKGSVSKIRYAAPIGEHFAVSAHVEGRVVCVDASAPAPEES